MCNQINKMSVGDDGGRSLKMLICLLLILCCVIIYGQLLQFDFLRYDEEQYVTKNAIVQSGLTWEGIKWAFTATEAGFWQPLVWLSHMLDCQVYGLKPAGHHLTNLILHMANTIILFLVLSTITGSIAKSGIMAGLFAVHPLHVETVAWIADRKDLMCTFFALLCLGCYAKYVVKETSWRFTLVIFTFLLSLMSKPALVALPIVLMFFDYWPLKRFDGFNMGILWRSLTEKSIMIILILPVIAMTFYAEARVEALPSLTAFPWESRMSNILNNYVGYLWKTVYPIDLAVFYPQPETRSLITDITAALFIIAVTIIAAVYVKKRPYLGCGWCWYVFLLLPMSGIVQVGSHVMADRYTYVPLVGIFLATVWYVDELIDRYYKENKLVSIGVVLAALGFLMVLSFKQTGYWRDTETLFRHAVEVTRNNYLAHNNLGAVLMEKGKTYEAIGHYQEAIKAKPNFTLSYVNLGNALVTAGQIEEGIRCYRQALDREPNNYTAARNLADALFKNRDYAEAILLYMELLPKMNQDAGLYNNLGVALAMNGRLEQAVGYLERAIALNPGDKLARANLQLLADKIRSGREQ